MGWVVMIVFSVLTFAALYFSRQCSRQVLELTGAVILVALAGYAWLGNPDMPGNPIAPGQGAVAAEQAQ